MVVWGEGGITRAMYAPHPCKIVVPTSIFIPAEMTRMALTESQIQVPGPQPYHDYSSGEPPPPIPPRTYSNRSLMNGRPPRKPMRRFKLEEFQFLKLLGKGSFGKVGWVEVVCGFCERMISESCKQSMN